MPHKIFQQCATQVPAHCFVDDTTIHVLGTFIAIFHIIISLQISGYTSRNLSVISVAFYEEILEMYACMHVLLTFESGTFIVALWTSGSPSK